MDLPQMRVTFLSFLVVSTALPSVVGKYLPPFKHKLSQHEAAYDKSFHDRLKGQVASQQGSHVSTSAKPSPSNTTHAPADASGGSFADGSTNSFTLYDSSNIPTPNPSTACVTALEATIACNSTVPLMRYEMLRMTRMIRADRHSAACTTSYFRILPTFSPFAPRHAPPRWSTIVQMWSTHAANTRSWTR
jgi:hypothetical protein